MSILIQDDGIITPFDIQSSNETKISLMPSTRDSYEEKDSADGDIDFETVYDMGEFILHGIIEFTEDDDKNAILDTLKGQLNNCRAPQELTYECQPDKYILVRLTGKPEIIEFPHHFEIRAQFKTDPVWYSVVEHAQTGSGTITNLGTFETPILIEIPGPATNPSISVGASIIAYNSAVAAGQILMIDTNTQTAYISAIAPINAMVAISGYIDYMFAPQISVTIIPSISAISVKWRDSYI